MPIADTSREVFEVLVNGTLAAGGSSSKKTSTGLYYYRVVKDVAFSGTAFITALRAAIEAEWLAFASAKWNLDTISVRCMNDPAEPATVVTVNSPGGVAGDALPSFANIIFNRLSGYRGARYRGRIFLPGIPESGHTDNTLTNAHVTIAEALRDALLLGITDAGNNQYIPIHLIRYTSRPTANPPVLNWVQVTSWTVNKVATTLKRRKTKAA